MGGVFPPLSFSRVYPFYNYYIDQSKPLGENVGENFTSQQTWQQNKVKEQRSLEKKGGVHEDWKALKLFK